ncbi:MAG: 2-hydroxychromene-2-carboxylate isomerase [Anaeromyxobacter sp.]|nr:2-hydroxychromene-2-carboxylate isomerase [Anaeromyxobacter sp.]MBL0278146.1 2-hydroxychromene-2-carboxylate isomerase [Anaeromyxobacter sp.]
MATLEFFFDFTSPYSYLASTQVEALAARTGATLRYRPFLLGGVFKATGNRAPIETVAKGRHMWTDLLRWSKRLEVPLRRPQTFPIPSILALRAVLAAPPEALGAASQAVFRAVWAEDREVGKPEVLAAVLTEAGLDGAALVAAAPGQKEALVAQTQEAVDRGAFGAPTFFVGSELFVGNDRLDFVEQALRGR